MDIVQMQALVDETMKKTGLHIRFEFLGRIPKIKVTVYPQGHTGEPYTIVEKFFRFDMAIFLRGLEMGHDAGYSIQCKALMERYQKYLNELSSIHDRHQQAFKNFQLGEYATYQTSPEIKDPLSVMSIKLRTMAESIANT